MYSNNEIIEKIHNDSDYYESLKNIMDGHPQKNDYINDLYHELILIISEYDNKKLNGMFSRGELKWFWYRIAKNNWQSSTSRFYYKYRKGEKEQHEYNVDLSNIEYEEDLERVHDELEKDDILYKEPYSELVRRVTEKTLEGLKNNDSNGWYKAKLFRLYEEKGSYRAVSEDTMIPEDSIGNTIREVKATLKKEISEELNRLGR